MTPELTTRLKKNLETLAERMPEKFSVRKQTTEGIRRATQENVALTNISFVHHNEGVLIYFYDIDGKESKCLPQPDPLGEFSNSIGRIVWEAFGEYLEVVHDLKGMGDTTRSSKFFMAYLFKQKENNELDQSSFLSRLYETTELSAQVEALCLRIEAGL